MNDFLLSQQQCPDDALQRQQQLLQSYKHCKRRRRRREKLKSLFNSLNEFLTCSNDEHNDYQQHHCNTIKDSSNICNISSSISSNHKDDNKCQNYQTNNTSTSSAFSLTCCCPSKSTALRLGCNNCGCGSSTNWQPPFWPQRGKIFVNKCWLIITMLLITLATTTQISPARNCLTEAAVVSSLSASSTSSSISNTAATAFHLSPLTALLKAAQDSSSLNNTPSLEKSSSYSSASSSATFSGSQTSAADAAATSNTNLAQQRQFQQQQLFELLKLNSMPQPQQQQQQQMSSALTANGATSSTSNESRGASSSATLQNKKILSLRKSQAKYLPKSFQYLQPSNGNRNHNNPNENNGNDNADGDDDAVDDDDDDDNDDDYIDSVGPRHFHKNLYSQHLSPKNLLETSGFVSDDGQQYEKAEKALAAAAAATSAQAGQQSAAGATSSNANNIAINNANCPKECKCLNDYFDCGKKHLDRVPQLPNYVQIIDFIANKLNDTSVLQIRNLPELNKLVLKRNQLETMPIFVGLTSLKQLNLAHNRIQKISPEALQALPKLKALDLSKNYLHAIEVQYFPQNNRLAHLILNSNEIATIEETAFESLPELLDLELNSNRLTSLPAGVFKNLNKLRKLSLNFNHLEINWSTFRGLTALQKLFLKSNNIRALQDGVFHVMRSIETIELDHNGITSLSRQGLFNLTKLHHLSLSNNSISRIELDTWEFTQSLISLDLSHNNISEFKPQHLECLQRLKHLNLGHNKIQYLLENTFDCVKNLEDLNLRRNKLSWIIEDPGASPPFKALRKLKKLDLYGNNLKQINTKSLSGLSSLESLNLGGNALASIQSGAFEHMLQLQKLMFKSLNFICDCDIIWFKRWLHRHLQSVGSAGGAEGGRGSGGNAAQAVCGYPEHLLDRELLSLQQTELMCAETPKPVLSQEPTNQLAVKGANITMECIATSPTAASLAAADELKIKWRHDNHNIKERDRSTMLAAAAAIAPSPLSSYTTTETQIRHEPTSNQTTIIGYLRLYNVSYESAGKYQCVVSNAFGTTYSQKFKISIGIHPSFLQIPSNLTIDSGDTARLVCSATGDPMPEIALQKFGASDFPAATERRLQVLREENAFVITNAKPIDSGIYTCTAESPAGEIKVNASLIVNDKPLPTIPMVNKEIVVGKSSVLECLNEMAAELNQPHREWYKDNKPFHITPTLDTERYYFTAERELLIIVNTQSVDAGLYRCEITDNSKTYTMQMELVVVKEDFSQSVIIVGVVLVTVACILIGSLIVWIILFFQKKKLYLSANQRNGVNGTVGGARVAAANSNNILNSASRGTLLDQTQMTTLNRTYLRSPRENYSQAQRPRSLAALELTGGRYQTAEDENQPLTEQRSCLIVTTTPNYQQLLMQRNAQERAGLLDDEHLTLEYLRLNSSHDSHDHQTDHLSSKDSGTGSDAAVKRSLEDFSITVPTLQHAPQHTSSPIKTSMATTPISLANIANLPARGRASLAKQDTDEDEDYSLPSLDATPPTDAHGSMNNHQNTLSHCENNDEVDCATSPTLGVSVYPMNLHEITRNNNHSPNSLLNYNNENRLGNAESTNGFLDEKSPYQQNSPSGQQHYSHPHQQLAKNSTNLNSTKAPTLPASLTSPSSPNSSMLYGGQSVDI